MSKESLGISSNFQHFLDVLSEIEYQKGDSRCETDELSSSEQRKCYSFASKNDNSNSKMKMRIQNRKILRQPGFVYRAKLRKTFLDNNLWEYSCSRRVLRSPSFKYHTTNIPSSSYSTNYVLNDLTSLSLGFSEEENCHKDDQDSGGGNWYENLLPAKRTTDNQNTSHPGSTANARGPVSLPVSTCSKDKHPPVTFLPLSSSPLVHRPKSIQVIKRGIHPGKLNILQLNSVLKTQENPQNSTKDSGVTSDKEFGGFYGNWNLSNRPTSYKQVSESNPVAFSTSQSLKRRTLSPRALFPKENPSNSLTPKNSKSLKKSCSYESRLSEQETSVEELSSYVEDLLVLPQKMSTMAEMMYT